jgi:hypothetical protein
MEETNHSGVSQCIMRLKSAGPESAFIAAGKVDTLVWVYSRDSEAEAMQAKVLTADEARQPQPRLGPPAWFRLGSALRWIPVGCDRRS